MTDNFVSLEDAMLSLRGRPGLVYGPLATIFPNSMALILDMINSRIGGVGPITEKNMPAVIDGLRVSEPDKAVRIERFVKEEINKLTGNTDIEWLVQAGWSVCISLTQDLLLESELENYNDAKPNSRTVTIIDHPSVRPQSRTIPIYKLLGSIRNDSEGHSLVLAESDLLRRKNIWPSILSTCADYLQGSPLLFFGTDDVVDLVKDLLSNLSAMQSPSPNSLMFLKADPILKDPTIRSLCNSFSNIAVVDATIREFSTALRNIKPRQKTLSLTQPDRKVSDIFSACSSILSLVPSASIDKDKALSYRQQLVDSLFRPNAIDWDPYLCDLDMVRDCVKDVDSAIDNIFTHRGTDVAPIVIVRGEAGVGKTTLLKRAAVNLSRKGYVSLWCKKNPIDNWIRSYKELSQQLSELETVEKTKGGQYLFFVDDPWALRIDPADLVACFDKCSAKVAFIFGIRNTEFFNQGGQVYTLPYGMFESVEVPTKLSEVELENLSGLLLKIGAVSDCESASSLIKNIPTLNAEDILCSLWYLIPETRERLRESLQDEYHRLGAVNSSIAAFAQNVNQISGKSAQNAYEFVAVTSKYQIGLPMELLVRALKISYEEFIEMTIDGKPLWGLIYDEKDDQNETVLFRTRNEIVTRVLLQLVNGGVGHAGEFRVLKSLLKACDIGSQVYRDFVIEVLVRSSKDMEKYFSFEQGLELFNVAQSALPYEDRLLEHHKGIWVHRVGKDDQKAYEQFEKALETQQYPGSEREAHAEHIHTSMAASVVGLVKSGKQAPDVGFELVQDHIQQALNPRIFNAHAGHVSANLLYEMAQQQGILEDNSVGISCYAAALHEVEKALQAIGAYRKNNAKSKKSMEMLKDLQLKIVESIPEDSALEEHAYSMFEKYRSQRGFELLLRKKLAAAEFVDKGSAYNSVRENFSTIITFIENSGESVSVDLLVIRVDLMIRWRLQRPSGSIDWIKMQQDIETVLQAPKYRDNPILYFYHAVALFHLGKIEQSNAIFAILRRMQAFGFMPNEIRCYALGPEGHHKRYQCNITRKHGRSYAEIPEIGADVPVAVGNRIHANHTYIGFTLNGPLAVYDRPDYHDSLIA